MGQAHSSGRYQALDHRDWLNLFSRGSSNAGNSTPAHPRNFGSCAGSMRHSLGGRLAYEIKSYWGAGMLVFGMSPDEVHELLGKPRFSRSDPGRLREIYRGCPALTFVGA